MKKASPLPFLAALFCAAPLAPTSAAADLQRAHIPAEARWVGHLDLQAFQRTTLWQRLRQYEDFEQNVLVELGDLERELGIDPFRDVFSVTVYGLTQDEEQTVVLLETTSAIDLAMERFAKEGDYQRLSHQGLEVHSWSDEGFVHVVSRPDDRRLVIVAPKIADLVEGVRVVQGQALSLSGNKASRLSAAPRSDSFAFFAAIDGIPGIHEIDPASQVAGLATGLVFDVGESSGELFLRASVQTADVDAALNLTKVGEGLVALAQLALSSHDVPAELSSLFAALQIETRGNEVSIEFHYMVDELLGLLVQLHHESDVDEAR